MFKVKVKRTLVHALRLCTGRTAYWGSRGIDLPFHDHGTRRQWRVSVTPRPLFTPGKDPVPIVQKAGWTPGPVWTGTENLAATGIRFPDRPTRSKSLYRLCYPTHTRCLNFHKIQNVPFVLPLSTAPLLHKNPSPARTSQNICSAQKHNEMDTAYLVWKDRFIFAVSSQRMDAGSSSWNEIMSCCKVLPSIRW